MKKLIYLSTQEIHDKTSWSGTIYKMYQTLSKEYDITEVVIKDSIIDKCFDLFMRIITINKVKKYPIKDLFKIKKLKRILNKYPNIPIFAPICSGLIAMLKDSNKKFIYLSDAVYEDMVGFYNNDSKLLVNKNNSLQKQALELSNQIIFLVPGLLPPLHLFMELISKNLALLNLVLIYQTIIKQKIN